MSPASTPMPWNERTVLRYASATCCGRSVATASALRARSTPSLDATRRCQLAAGYLAIQQALSAIDRMEVRGRDSAGLHVFVWDGRLDLDPRQVPEFVDELRDRSGDRLFQARSVRSVDGPAGSVLSFVYKAAAEIGELGDNTAALRSQIVGDDLLRRALSFPWAEVSVLGHTRWASVGIISEPNAHPVNSDELELAGQSLGGAQKTEPAGPYVVGVLNGDVDNHADLQATHGLRIAGQITTDAKVIPTLVSRNAQVTGDDRDGIIEAFRRAVASFDGSVAIGAATSARPELMLLALRGSGQGIYIGIAEDRYVVASEPYGIVEETDRFVRLDGEHGGQLVALDALQAGTLEGIHRFGYDGSPWPVTDADVAVAEVTTRDIDRGDAPTSCSRRSASHRTAWPRRCAARSSMTVAGCVPSSADGPCPRRSPTGWRLGRSPGSKSSDRARRRWPAAPWR